MDLRVLQDDLLLDKGNKVLVELICLDLCQLEELLVTDNWILIKHKQQEHLIGRTKELVTLPCFKGTANLCVPKG